LARLGHLADPSGRIFVLRWCPIVIRGRGRDVADETERQIPVLTLVADEISVPDIVGHAAMGPDRLRELRSALAALADRPIATLEVHPLPDRLDRGDGIALNSSSPLAQQLTSLVAHTPRLAAAGRGEALYRMVVPAKVAAQFGGAVTPMVAKAVPDGIHSALVGSSGITAQAAFVPVAGVGAFTVAAPLITFAVAAGLSARAEVARRQELERITSLLEKLHEDRLDDERSQLDGCVSAIEKAAAILLDEGLIGHAVGVSPAVGVIDTAIAKAQRRVGRWEQALKRFGDGPVEAATVKKAFPGIDDPSGEFRAHLELAALAIDLKRRVIVLQAVEQAQLNAGNPFERFVRQISADLTGVNELASRISTVRRQLSRLQLDRTHGLRDFVFSAGEVDDLLRLSRELRDLGDIDIAQAPADIAIGIVRASDGSVVVLPALTDTV
jgi:hypothetical protein